MVFLESSSGGSGAVTRRCLFALRRGSAGSVFSRRLHSGRAITRQSTALAATPCMPTAAARPIGPTLILGASPPHGKPLRTSVAYAFHPQTRLAVSPSAVTAAATATITTSARGRAAGSASTTSPPPPPPPPPSQADLRPAQAQGQRRQQPAQPAKAGPKEAAEQEAGGVAPSGRPNPATPPPPPPSQASTTSSFPASLDDVPMAVKLAQKVRSRAPVVTETYVAYGATEKLYQQCAAQADYTMPQADASAAGEVRRTASGIEKGVGQGWWYDELRLMPTFNSWAQVTMLHMYCLTARLRCFPAAHAPTWQQHLVDHFFHDAERRMAVAHRIVARSLRTRYLKDLHGQFRGALAAYDEGLCRGDAVLAAALWRNVLGAGANLDDAGDPASGGNGSGGGSGGGGSGDEGTSTTAAASTAAAGTAGKSGVVGAAAAVDLRKLALLVAYLRHTLHAMERVPDEALAAGQVRFADPARLEALVRVRSRLFDRPFAQEMPPRASG